MSTRQLVRPSRLDQCAALMLTAFKANPGVVMTLREVESLVDLSGFSKSTRQRATNVVLGEGVKYTSVYPPMGREANTYWLPTEVS